MTRIDDTRRQEGVLQPPAGVGPFHWHRCEACAKRGYRSSLPRNNVHLQPHWQSAKLDPLTYTKVMAWHSKIAHEMWADYINRSVNNMKE